MSKRPPRRFPRIPTNAEFVATVRTPFPELIPLFKVRQIESGYESLSEYFFSAGFYDVLLRKPHRVTPWLWNQEPEIQQQYVRSVVAKFDDPHKPGGWLEHRIQEAAQEELWRLHAEIRELREQKLELEARVRELEEASQKDAQLIEKQ